MGHLIYKVFCQVADFGFLNTQSFNILEHMRKENFKIGGFKLTDEIKDGLEYVYLKMLKDFEIEFSIDSDLGSESSNNRHEVIMETQSAESNTLDATNNVNHRQNSQIIPDTQSLLQLMSQNRTEQTNFSNNTTVDLLLTNKY